MFGLSLFRRTSNRRCFNLAAFHSPHSLTWSWILSLTFGPIGSVKPYARFKMRGTHVPGFHIGLGQLIGCMGYADNNGVHWSASLLWAQLMWTRQQPMYYRNMYDRASDARDRLEKENRNLRWELSQIEEGAAALQATPPAHVIH